MEPGPDAIKQLERLHPTARWAWYQKEECFALLELYPAAQSDNIAYEHWGKRGTVYGAPFDPLAFQPYWLANFHPKELQTLSFTPTIRRWQTSMRERMMRSAEREAQRFEDDIHEIASDMGDKMYHDSHRDHHRPSLVPYKFLTQEEKDSLGGQNMLDVKRGFMPNI